VPFYRAILQPDNYKGVLLLNEKSRLIFENTPPTAYLYSKWLLLLCLWGLTTVYAMFLLGVRPLQGAVQKRTDGHF